MIEGENEDNIDYKEKDIVWAKVKEYPWWPSIINHISYPNIQTNGENIKEKLYSIEFIGEKNKFKKLTKEKLEPFNKNYEQHINTKNSSLLNSIELAKKIFDKKQNTKMMFLKENTQDKNNKKEKDMNNISNQNLSTKKSHDSSDEKSKGEKENEKNIKFLQKKRINERVIVDSNEVMNDINNDEENKDIKNNVDNKDDKKILSSPKNNIKINININLTTNNQNMVNINSFHSSNVLSQNNPNNNNIISNTNFNPINYSSLSGNDTNNINKINNKNNNLNQLINIDEESIISSIGKKQNKNENMNNSKKGEKEENNNSIEYNEEENESEEENENDEIIITNDVINEIIKKLLNCQIQMSNISSQKTIISELIKLSEKLNELLSKNPDLEIYSLTKDLIPILATFTYNKNNEILMKTSEILSFLNEKIINEIFILSPKEQKNLIDSLNNENDKETNQNEIEENDYKEGLNIIEMINQKNVYKSNISENQHVSFSKRGRPKKNSMNSEISSEFFSSKNEGVFNMKDNFNLNENNIYDEFIKIISCKDKDKMENDFQEISNNFFSNIYDKNNKDLDTYMAKMRKHICIKIFKIIHKFNPEINKDFLKKIIVYFEYKIRNDNSNLEYSNKINSFLDIMKERLYDKAK